MSTDDRLTMALYQQEQEEKRQREKESQCPFCGQIVPHGMDCECDPDELNRTDDEG